MMDVRAPRTVRQIPVRHAARFVPAERPRPPVRPGMFPIARQLLVAETDQQRAAILLRVPDSTVLEKSRQLSEACTEAAFPMGATFVDLRLAALTARRNHTGRLPEHLVRSLEIWRDGFVALANGVKA